jgi:hypothetical protein
MALKRNKSAREQRRLERKLVLRLKSGKGGRLPEWKTNRGHRYAFQKSFFTPAIIGITGGCRWWVSWKGAFDHYYKDWRTPSDKKNCTFEAVWPGVHRESERRHCRAVLRDMQRIARLAGLKLGAPIEKKSKAAKKRKRKAA